MSLDQLRMQSMSPQEQAVFQSEVAAREKSTAVGYLLWFLFGFHYAYVGKWGAQILFWLTGGGLFLWWLVDLFRVPSIIEDRNREIRDQVSFSIVSLRSGAASLPQIVPAPNRAAEVAVPLGERSIEADLATKLGFAPFVVQMAIPLVLGGALFGMASSSWDFNRATLDPGTDAMCLCGLAAGRGASELASVQLRGGLWGLFFGAMFLAVLAVLNPRRDGGSR